MKLLNCSNYIVAEYYTSLFSADFTPILNYFTVVLIIYMYQVLNICCTCSAGSWSVPAGKSGKYHQDFTRKSKHADSRNFKKIQGAPALWISLEFLESSWFVGFPGKRLQKERQVDLS